MPVSVRIDVDVDDFGIGDIDPVLKEINNPNSTGPIRRAMVKSAKQAVRSYKARHLAMSQPGSLWPPIEKSTEKKKGNRRKLWNSGLINNSIISWQIRGGFRVGVRSRKKHPGGGNWTVQKVVGKHSTGAGTSRGKVWNIFTPPKKNLRDKISLNIRLAILKVIRQNAK